MAHKSPPKGGIIRHFAHHRIGLLRACNPELQKLPGRQILNLHRTAQTNVTTGFVFVFNDHRMGKDILNFRDTAKQLCLLISGLVVFTVFRQVALGARFFNILYYLLHPGSFQVIQFLFQFLDSCSGQLEFFRHNKSSPFFGFASTNFSFACDYKRFSQVSQVLFVKLTQSTTKPALCPTCRTLS